MVLQRSAAQLELLCQESRQAGILVMTWFFSITAIVVVSLRLYCRSKFGKGLGWDDYTIVTGVIIGFPDSVLLTEWVHAGLGKHIECLDPAKTSATLRWCMAVQAHHIVCLMIVKVSLCLSVRRVIDRVERRIATFLWVNIAVIGASHVAQMAMLLSQCKPLSAWWDPRLHESCFSSHTSYLTTYITFSLDAFTDLVCAVIPVFVISRTQMNARTKFALCVLMGLGVFTAMCAVAKAITLKGMFTRDFTWNEVAPAQWASAEQALGLILVSLPILRPLFRNFFAHTESDHSFQKAPTIGRRFHRVAPPDYSLLKITNNGNSFPTGRDASSVVPQNDYANPSFPQIPLAAYLVERPVELDVRAKHDLETGQWAEL